MHKVFHYPWRAAANSVHWRLPSPSGDVVSPEVGAFVDCGDGRFCELPGPTIREGTGQNRVQIKDGGQFQLLVSTLTPDYKVEKKASWITVGSKTRESMGKYYIRCCRKLY